MGPRHELVHDLLDRNERPPGREDGFLLDAGETPEHDVAVPVGLLRMDDGDVRVDRLHGADALAVERALHGGDGPVLGGEVGALVPAQDAEREAGGARGIGGRQPGVGVLHDLELARPAVLDGVAEAVQRADAGVAAVREGQPACPAHADQLVVDDVRGHADERQLLSALADDLVGGRERHEVREALERELVTVAHQLRDRVGERRMDHGRSGSATQTSTPYASVNASCA